MKSQLRKKARYNSFSFVLDIALSESNTEANFLEKELDYMVI